MKILAFELSNFASSMAVLVDDEVLAFEQSDQFRGQDVTLLSKMEGLLTKVGLTFSDLDRLVTTTGPGSFTGIRVGLATAQGLSLSLNKPALGIGSFHWVRHHACHRTSKKILLVLESMREELYVQDEGMEPCSLSPMEIASQFDADQYLVVGNGAHHLESHGFEVHATMPDARDLARQAAKIPANEYDQFLCVPTYVRAADTSISKKKI